MISESSKKAALLLARESIKSHLNARPLPKLDISEKIFQESRGVFVTLRNKTDLRGCIGITEGRTLLIEDIPEIAISAASLDPRFDSITKDEFDDIHIEISILSPPEEVNDISEIEIGKHGVIIESGFNRGLLLPQVAKEENWDKITFLRHACRKAGLSPDDWESPETKIYRFFAEVFSEDKI